MLGFSQGIWLQSGLLATALTASCLRRGIRGASYLKK